MKLEARLAVWRYWADSAAHIFGRPLGDAKANEALGLLTATSRAVAAGSKETRR